MTGNQLELIPKPAKPLTGRQQLALDHITANQPVPSDEVGAILHEDRRARGGRGHSRDERCKWCADEGKTMGASLRSHGLIVRRRGAGWTLPDYRIGDRPASGYDPATAPFPEGF